MSFETSADRTFLQRNADRFWFNRSCCELVTAKSDSRGGASQLPHGSEFVDVTLFDRTA
jgi:hypothetical protein